MKVRFLAGGFIFMLLSMTLLATSASAQEKQEAAQTSAPIPVPTNMEPGMADLVIKGKINRSGNLYIDLKSLISLPSVSFTSLDPWDGKSHKFTGVLLKDVMTWVGIENSVSTLVLTARNQYSIPIRRDDYEKFGYIIAYRMDGTDFSANPATKKRGPLAIAIDLTKNKKLDPEIYKHQLVWQLAEILVR